jgi:N-acetylneuraminic acid mutarotase
MRQSILPSAIASLLLGAIALCGFALAQGAPPGTWSTKTPRPEPTNEAAVVAIGGKLVAPGGSQQGSGIVRVDEYDIATDRWRRRADMPQPLDHLALTVLNGKLYTFGGFATRTHAGSTEAALEYDPATDAWRRLTPMQVPRGAAGAAVVGGKIHVIGGRVREGEMLARHDVYDPATGTWSAAAPLPQARDHLAVVEAEGKIHVIGGRTGSQDDQSERHDIYDPATNTWTSGPPLPTPRSSVTGVLYKGLILVTGGERRTGTYNENEAYDLKAGRWVTLSPLPAGRHGHGATAAGNTVYFLGGALGSGGGGVTAELLTFTLP